MGDRHTIPWWFKCASNYVGETARAILATNPPTLQLTKPKLNPFSKHLDLSAHNTDRITPTLERERERERHDHRADRFNRRKNNSVL